VAQFIDRRAAVFVLVGVVTGPDVLFRDHDLGLDLPVHQACPEHLVLQLLAILLQAQPLPGEAVSQLAVGHAVALLHLLHRTVHGGLAHGDVEALGLLIRQPLVDQLIEDLFAHLEQHLAFFADGPFHGPHTAGEGFHGALEFVQGDDVVVDFGHNPVHHFGRVGRRGYRPCPQDPSPDQKGSQGSSQQPGCSHAVYGFAPTCLHASLSS
jgi:hypothetical protein